MPPRVLVTCPTVGLPPYLHFLQPPYSATSREARKAAQAYVSLVPHSLPPLLLLEPARPKEQDPASGSKPHGAWEHLVGGASIPPGALHPDQPAHSSRITQKSVLLIGWLEG